jgi:hypothetical protein
VKPHLAPNVPEAALDFQCLLGGFKFAIVEIPRGRFEVEGVVGA